MNSIKKESHNESKKMPVSEFIDLIKKKYPTPEERLSFVNLIPVKVKNGKINLEYIQKKALLMQILFIDFS